jgi:hypothetical protein
MAAARPKCCYTVQCDYVPSEQILIVEFTGYKKSLSPPPLDGRPYLYLYYDVPQEVWDTWSAMDCDGTWYNYNIRGQPSSEGYTYTRER